VTLTEDFIFSGEFAQDRKHAADFVAEAREKYRVSLDPKSGVRAFLLVGDEEWPFPVPIIKKGNKWLFDTKAPGRNSCTAESVPMSCAVYEKMSAPKRSMSFKGWSCSIPIHPGFLSRNKARVRAKSKGIAPIAQQAFLTA
jgi:hypothetical protein